MKIHKVRLVVILVSGTVIDGLILNSVGVTGDLFGDLFVAFAITFIGAWIIELIFRAGNEKSGQDQMLKIAEVKMQEMIEEISQKRSQDEEIKQAEKVVNEISPNREGEKLCPRCKNSLNVARREFKNGVLVKQELVCR